MSSDNERDYNDEAADVTEENTEIEFKPIVTVQPVSVKSDEDIGEIFYKTRAKLYRFDTIQKEWKERGTGDVKFIKMNDSNKVHLIMRREKTHKLCANHLIAEDMELKPSAGSDRSWVWQVYADYADGEANSEILAIRFANSEVANEFKGHFDASKASNSKQEEASAEKSTKEEKTAAHKNEQKEEQKEPEESREDKNDPEEVKTQQESSEEAPAAEISAQLQKTTIEEKEEEEEAEESKAEKQSEEVAAEEIESSQAHEKAENDEL